MNKTRKIHKLNQIKLNRLLDNMKNIKFKY